MMSEHKAFTLIEAILYLAIVSFVLTAAISFYMSLGNTAAKMAANIDASRERRGALSTIEYLIKNSDGMLKDVNGDCSDFDASPQVLALYFASDDHLPGTCVENGGGVKISIDSNRVLMTCYPNITNNGQYQACSATAGNSYYLTGTGVEVTNLDLDFNTSTATSTANYFTAVTAHLGVRNLSGGQVYLQGFSEATTTIVLRNEQPSGLVAWYKFDDGNGTTAVDSSGNGLDLTCTNGPVSTTALITGSSAAYWFYQTDASYCYIDNPAQLNLGSSFTLSAWLKSATEIDSSHNIVWKQNTTKGYYFYNLETTGDIIFGVCNNTACTDVLTASGDLTVGNIFHVTVVYDQPNDIAKMFVYQKGVSGISTTTASSLPILVNDSTANYPRIGENFDGVIDEMRIYDRALTNSEIWALQSAGDY